MAHVDLLGGVVEDRRLDRPLQELLGVAAKELVERVVAGDVDGEPAPLAAPGAAPLLAEARHRAGKGDRDGGIEVADVDAELERARGDHAEELSLGEPALDLAPLLRRIAGPVGSDAIGRGRSSVLLQAHAGELVDQLGGATAAGEADRARARGDQVGEELGRLAEAGLAPA
jgi:hypothetical protein